MSSTINDDSVWFYVPNLGAAIAFAMAFALIASCIVYRFHTTKGGRAFFWSVMIGMAFEVIGFSLRAVGRDRLDQVGPFASQQSLIVLAPLFIAAGNYLVTSCMICTISKAGRKERVLRIPARLITKIFVTCDVVTILIQVGGTSISASNNWAGKTADIGSYVLLAGLAIQTVTVAFFVIMLLRFGRSELFVLRPRNEYLLGIKATFISSICIELRCIYRLIEHATGYEGYLFTHEWNFYVFEALPMIIATAIFVVWYPPSYVPSEGGQDCGMQGGVTGKELRSVGSVEGGPLQV